MDTKIWESLDMVREREMLKGERGNAAGGPHCALGFLDEAYGMRQVEMVPEAFDAVRLLRDVAAEVFPGREDSSLDCYNWTSPGNVFAELAAFNNHPDTTKADLEVVFEKAAVKSDEILG